MILLGAAPVFALAYLSLPTDGAYRTIAYPTFGLVATIAIALGIRINRPARSRAWVLIALGLALLSIGDVAYSLLALSGPEVPYPSLADVPYLTAYAAIILGVQRLVSGRMPGGDRMPMLDGAILAAGVGSLLWLVVIRPSLQGSVDILASTVSLAYPTMDLLLLGLTFRVLLSSHFREPWLQFIVAGLGLYFVGDAVYALAVLDGTYAPGHPVDAFWIIGITLLAVAALHPSASMPVRVASQRSDLSRVRLSMLAIAAFAAPVIILMRALSQGGGDEVGLVITWTILFGLVLIRLASTVDELAVSLLQRRRLQDELRFEADHDPLTRLANRGLFERRLSAELAAAAETTALVFLDLDDFKAINDTLGHGSGDDVLRIVAERIRRDLRAGDLAARLGGDEFAVLLTGCSDIADAAAIAERILAMVRTPVELDGRPFQIRASAGVATGRPGASPADLMRDADVAMYQAKTHGKDQAQAYEAEAHDRVVRGFALRTELAEAIARGQFELAFQPAIDSAAELMVGAEALVRWRHPVRGILGPAEFIGHAESSGLIHDLGRWILREACRTAVVWPLRADGHPIVVSVNISPAQLQNPSFIEDVRAILAETGLPASRLILEVTESALVELEPAANALQRLRQLGIRLALDDFGTGYSSLSYLARLPFGVVKIDRTFIASLGSDPRVEALLGGIVQLCHQLGLQLCAEGIETEAQLTTIRRLGFDAAQGYLLARPLAAASMVELVGASEEAPLRDGALHRRQMPSRRALRVSDSRAALA